MNENSVREIVRKRFYLLTRLSLILGVFWVVNGCNFMDNDDVLMLTKANHQRTVTLKLEQTLKIILDSNPSTGNVWEFSGNAPPALLRLDTKEYRPDETDNPPPGSGGQDVFTLTPLATGEAYIVMFYERPGDFVPTNMLQVTIIIGGR